MSATPPATSPGDDPRSSGSLRSFLTVNPESALLGARILQAGFGIAMLDSGPGGVLTVSLSVQAVRVTTGSIPLTSTSNVTVTWPLAFADANYTPSVSLLDASGFLTIQQITAIAAASIAVNVKNSDGALAHTGTLLCLALHD